MSASFSLSEPLSVSDVWSFDRAMETVFSLGSLAYRTHAREAELSGAVVRQLNSL